MVRIFLYFYILLIEMIECRKIYYMAATLASI